MSVKLTLLFSSEFRLLSILDLKIRICFVGYRDHCDRERFAIHEFTDDVEKIKKYISSVQAIGGGDFPEDVVGDLRKCLDQHWSANSSKQVFHI